MICHIQFLYNITPANKASKFDGNGFLCVRVAGELLKKALGVDLM